MWVRKGRAAPAGEGPPSGQGLSTGAGEHREAERGRASQFWVLCGCGPRQSQGGKGASVPEEGAGLRLKDPEKQGR